MELYLFAVRMKKHITYFLRVKKQRKFGFMPLIGRNLYNNQPDGIMKEHGYCSEQKGKGWRTQMIKLAFTETFYGICKYMNDAYFGHNVKGLEV